MGTKDRSPTQTAVIVHDFMNEGENFFPFVFWYHPSTNNLHSYCQKHTMILILPDAWYQRLNYNIHLSFQREWKLFFHRCALFVTSKVFRWRWKNTRIWCVIVMRAMYYCEKRKGNEFRLFHSHLAFIALTRDEGAVKERICVHNVLLPGKRQALNPHYVINSAAVARTNA